MMKRALPYCLFILFAILTLGLRASSVASKGDIIVDMPKSKGTVYELFEIISQKTGLQFVYDSSIIHNEQRASIKKGSYTLYQAVRQITGNKNLEVRVMGNHILITRTSIVTTRQVHTTTLKHEGQLLLTGLIVDKSSQRPLEASSIRVEGTSIGNVTNSSGEFRLILPDSLSNSYIIFSHLGYHTQIIEVSKIFGAPHTIALQERVVPLQEVVLRLSNPFHLLEEMRKNKKRNYLHSPIYTTTFYREGIEYEKRFVKMNEGAFKVYKPSTLSAEPDKVELLKMRNIVSQNAKDSVMAKIKAGIDASLLLDIAKNETDFLDPISKEYDFMSTGITSVDDRMVNVIYFKQKDAIDQPNYCGELYIDSEDYALVGAQFEINPKYVKSATSMFVVRKARGMKVIPQKVSYNLSYKKWNGHYYINYVRGDLVFKIHKRLFSSSTLHTWFEMATCKIDTVQVIAPKKEEVLPRHTIFEEVHFPYDESFWENFNIIPLENKLSESIEKITLKIEEVLNDKK